MLQKRLTVMIGLVLATPFVTTAEETNATNNEQLDTVTVVENDNSIDSTLKNIDTINTADLSNPSVTDMATALDNQTSVSFNFDGNGNAIYPIIRGMGENYTEVTIDGDKAPTYFTYGHGLYNTGQRSFVETDTLKQIDIVKGRHSPKQSSGALSGTINLRTYDPSDFVNKDDPYYFSIKSGYSTRNDSFGNSLTGAVASGDFGAMVIYSHRESNEVENVGNDADKTKHSKIDNTQDNILLKGEYRFGSAGRIIATGEHFDAERTTAKRYSDKPNTEEPTTRDRFSIKGEFNHIMGLDVLEAKISYQELDNTSQYWSTYGKQPQYKQGKFSHERLSFALDGTKSINVNSINNTLLFGLGHARSEFDFTRINVTDKHAYRPLPVTERDITHVYLKNSMTFANGLTIAPGVRVEHKTISSQPDKLYQNNGASAIRGIEDGSNTTVVPSLSTSWAVSDDLTLHANYSEGEKTADDVNFTSTDHGKFYLLPNPNLKDETSKHIEFGLTYAINDDFTVDINAYQTKYDNFITYKNGVLPNGTAIAIPTNIGSVSTRGIEMSSDMALSDSFDAHLGLAWMSGSQQYGENSASTLLSAHPTNAVIGLHYHNADIWGAGLNFRLSGKGAKSNNPVLFQTPGYGVANLTAWWKPMKNMKISGGVYNVFDKKYWGNDINGTYTQTYRGKPINMDRYTQPGRNVGINVKYEL